MIGLLLTLLGPGAPAQEPTAAPVPVVLVSSRTAIHRFTADGERLSDLVPAEGRRVAFAQQMAVGPDGHLYVASYFRGVDAFTLEGEHVRTVSTDPALQKPGWVRFDGDVLVVSWTESGRITRHAVLDGDRPLPDLVRRRDGPLARPHAWLRRPDGTILVCELDRLSLFDADGEHQRDVRTGLGRVLGLARLDEHSLLVTHFFGPPQVLDERSEELVPFTTGRVGRGGDGALVWGERVLLSYNETREVLEYGRDGRFVRVFADAEDGLDRANGLLRIEDPRAAR